MKCVLLTVFRGQTTTAGAGASRDIFSCRCVFSSFIFCSLSVERFGVFALKTYLFLDCLLRCFWSVFGPAFFYFPVWLHFDYSPSAKHVRRSATPSSVFVFFTPVFTPVRPGASEPAGRCFITPCSSPTPKPKPGHSWGCMWLDGH